MRYNLDIIDAICQTCNVKELLAWQLVSEETKDVSSRHLYRDITVFNKKQLVLLQNALVLRPRLRPLIRRLVIQKRVISLGFRGSTQPSGEAKFEYVYGDVDMVECLSALIIPLPNLSHLELNAPLTTLCVADPYIMYAMNLILQRSLKNTIVINSQSVKIDPPKCHFRIGKSKHRLSIPYMEDGTDTFEPDQISGTPSAAAVLSASRKTCKVCVCNLTTRRNFDILYPLPMDESGWCMGKGEPVIPVLHWLGLDSWLTKKVDMAYTVFQFLFCSDLWLLTLGAGVIYYSLNRAVM